MLEEAADRDRSGGEGDNVQYNGYWVWSLRTSGRENALGLLGVVARDGQTGPSPAEREVVEELVQRAETALEDRLLQQGVFMAVMEIMPQIERVQRWRSVVPYPGTPPLQQPAETDSIIYQLEFTKWVKDALSHYWGGPKLTDSPLLRLKVVNKAAEEEGSPTKGLRAVLAQAIEGLRPEGQRQMTASEWLLYNILDMKFIQGKRVREIADRLAMSESDLYRKQRVAIEQVALKIIELEAENGEEEEVEAEQVGRSGMIGWHSNSGLRQTHALNGPPLGITRAALHESQLSDTYHPTTRMPLAALQVLKQVSSCALGQVASRASNGVRSDCHAYLAPAPPVMPDAPPASLRTARCARRSPDSQAKTNRCRP